VDQRRQKGELELWVARLLGKFSFLGAMINEEIVLIIKHLLLEVYLAVIILQNFFKFDKLIWTCPLLLTFSKWYEH
jgi:hypothetical protein